MEQTHVSINEVACYGLKRTLFFPLCNSCCNPRCKTLWGLIRALNESSNGPLESPKTLWGLIRALNESHNGPLESPKILVR